MKLNSCLIMTLIMLLITQNIILTASQDNMRFKSESASQLVRVSKLSLKILLKNSIFMLFFYFCYLG